ncbi:sigma-70 family RNA polymerase sigma factor [Pandoraea sp. ISTKB]|uniref:sigma-70 family RNA polymerase sigma factor n=1 Tax=Pandoraea sp. ISTKB TaxID=1586708 RepID=UPI001F0AC55F|nr:RNA polymerase sigma factor [Pandoraea sp. ISTKB]
MQTIRIYNCAIFCPDPQVIVRSLPDSRVSPLIAALVRHYDELVDHVRRRFGGRGFANDVVHDVCLGLIENPPQDTIVTPLAFLRTASTHRAIDLARASDRLQTWQTSTAEMPDTRADNVDGLAHLEFMELLYRLEQTISALPERCRLVFLLHGLHELPQAEVAIHMGISRSMVAKHMSRAMQEIALVFVEPTCPALVHDSAHSVSHAEPPEQTPGLCLT